MASKIAQLCKLVEGSLIFDRPMAGYHVALALRDANRCGTTAARFNAMRKAAKKTRLAVRLGEMGAIHIRNHETGAEYIAQP